MRKIILSKLETEKFFEPSKPYTHFYILRKDSEQGENLGFAFSYKQNDVYPLFFQQSPLPGEKEILIGIAKNSKEANQMLHDYMVKQAQKELRKPFGPYEFKDSE